MAVVKRLICVALLVCQSIVATKGLAVDLILHHGKIVTVDSQFSIAEAIAITGDRIVRVGSNQEVLDMADAQTQVVDLRGKMVLPGLIDSHVHATSAAEYEFDHTVPEMNNLTDVLSYIRQRAAAMEAGHWIMVSQVFVTRLEEQRFPTRKELDEVAPEHPVFFRTGPDAALNSLALRLTGIDRDFKITDGEPGFIERDPVSGEPTGILRSCTRLVKANFNARRPTTAERIDRLKQLLHDYNSVGITSICDRNTSDDAIELFSQLHQSGQLTCRAFFSYAIDAQQPLVEIQRQVEKAAGHPLHQYNSWLWLRGAKIFLDGGMLTGSAYMKKPWGVSSIYAITDPNYRGLLYVQPEKLFQIAKICLEKDLQITAHSVGDGAVEALIAAYAEVDKELPLANRRPCITHCNFMSGDAIKRMKELGIVADLQPIWLWMDGKTLLKQFGHTRTEFFQPYRMLFDSGVVIGGGSDHMQKVGSFRAVNPYNPFLGMWIAIHRVPRGQSEPLNVVQRIRREEAIRLYTINNAFLTFEEKEKGSLEPGKLADLIVIDRDLLTCPEADIVQTQVLSVLLGGKEIYKR